MIVREAREVGPLDRAWRGVLSWGLAWGLGALGSIGWDRNRLVGFAVGLSGFAVAGVLASRQSASRARASRLHTAVILTAAWGTSYLAVVALGRTFAGDFGPFTIPVVAAACGFGLAVTYRAQLGSRARDCHPPSVVWAVTFAGSAYLIVASWYVLAQALFKPLLGVESGFGLAAFLSGALWGGLTAVICLRPGLSGENPRV